MWTSFAGIVAGAGAGLTGLMFIVVSFRYDVIAASDEYRNRAAQSLSLFLTVTVSGALITVPQSVQALGAELLLVAIGSATLLKSLDSAARRAQSGRTDPALLVALTVFFSSIAITGLLLMLGKRNGLYFYVAGAILGLVWGVYGAWLYLTRAGVA